ncbi:MAG: carboxylating nicotinate-nucleotide diphosphorylase [Gammaproteobacteria bacterium]
MNIDLPTPPPDLAVTVRRALEEDLGGGDLTAALIPPAASARATVLCREPAVICGRPWFDAVFRMLDPTLQIVWQVDEGQAIAAGTTLCTLKGNARSLLTGERTALNFLQMLSGTASAARQYAEAVAGTGCQVLDTRKTIPGLRLAQKYATACGGVRNHRVGLFDGILIKENHIMAAGGIDTAIAAARGSAPDLPVEVEVEDADELRAALAAGADIVMLDNFDLEQMRAAVALNRETRSSPALLEASGNVDISQLPDIAATGVDFVSVGAVTKHVAAVDLSMRFYLD